MYLLLVVFCSMLWWQVLLVGSLVGASSNYLDWEDVVLNTYFRYNLEEYPLKLRTASKPGSNGGFTVGLYFEQYPNDFFYSTIAILLSDPPTINVQGCFEEPQNFTVLVSNGSVDSWTISRTDTALLTEYNDVLVFELVFSEFGSSCETVGSYNTQWLYFPDWYAQTQLQYQPHHTEFEDCSIVELTAGNKRYLKEACHYDNMNWYRCPFSNDFYGIVFDYPSGQCTYLTFDIVCENDSHFYQQCGHGCYGYTTIEGKELFCSQYTCHAPAYGEIYGGSVLDSLATCNGKYECNNTKIDESLDCRFDEEQYKCKDGEVGKSVAVSKVCDYRCDCHECDDEGNCNNVTYGINCEHDYSHYYGTYLPASRVCDGETKCTDGSDEMNCTADNAINTCPYSGKERYILPINVCAKDDVQVCDNGKEQTNCTDPARIAMTCPLDGYNTSISIFAVCEGYPLCDDNYNNNCVEVEGECVVHKNQLCDNITDCPEGSDESKAQCSHLTEVYCKRRYTGNGDRNTPLPIPSHWVVDGEMDCENGEDENTLLWKKCGEGEFTRYIPKEEECDDVLKCKRGEGFIPFSELCDREETCDGESKLCEISRNFKETYNFIKEEDNTKTVGYCHPGLEEVQKLAHQCIKTQIQSSEKFSFALKTTELIIPSGGFDCRYVYGEMYVFLACTGICKDTICPIRPVTHDTCLNKLDETFLSVTESNTLSVLLKTNGQYHNDIFTCDNKNCIDYKEVCNLVDDCGDGSDERNCTNHYFCPMYEEYIPIPSKCNGHVDCRDSSDECNSDCDPTKRQILGNMILKIIAWTIGILAIMFNVYNIYTAIDDIRLIQTFSGLMNKSLVLLISIGDLLMGLYLVLIACADAYYGTDYCHLKHIWLSSVQCSLLGVFSTLATQISLFAMTALSIFRICTISMILQPSLSNYTSKLQISGTLFIIIFLSIVTSILPVIPHFEDYFVNGLYYHQNPLFTGSVTKQKHYDIFKKHFGYFSGKNLSWDNIRRLVQDMFTNDYGGVEGRKVHFYGNDGVCVFKYLVTENDSQKLFTVATLIINFICFVVISICYLFIILKTYRSSKNVVSSTNSETQTRKTQAKISGIIFTDFICWVPLTGVCFFHFCGFIDASEWYPVFSIILLPINSLINPIIYNNAIGGLICMSGDVIVRTSTIISTPVSKLMSRRPAVDMGKRRPNTDIELSLARATIISNINDIKSDIINDSEIMETPL